MPVDPNTLTDDGLGRMHHAIVNVLAVDDNAWTTNVHGDQDILKELLQVNGLMDWDDFILMNFEDIGALKRRDGSDAPITAKNKLRIMLSFYHFCSAVNSAAIDAKVMRKEAFDNFRISEYDPTAGLTIWSKINKEETKKEMQDWKKLNKPNARAYPELKDASNTQRWIEDFEDTAKAQDLEMMIGPEDYVPDNEELDQAQQKFFYKVLVDSVKPQAMKAIVYKHRATKNTRLIWKEITEHIKTSMTNELEAQKHSTWLSSTRLHTSGWRGTQESYLTAFGERARLHNEIAPPDSQLSDGVLVSMLNIAVAGTPNLANVLTLYRTAQSAAGHPMSITFEEFSRLLQHSAQTHDGGVTSTGGNPSRRSVNTHEHYNHDGFFDDYFEEETNLDCNAHDSNRRPFRPRNGSRKPNRVRMDLSTWKSLNQEDQEAWDSISEDGKGKVLDYQKRKTLKAQEKDNQDRQAYEHEHIFDEDIDPEEKADDDNGNDLEVKAHELEEDNKNIVDYSEPEDKEVSLNFHKIMGHNHPKTGDRKLEVKTAYFERPDWTPEDYSYEPSTEQREVSLYESAIVEDDVEEEDTSVWTLEVNVADRFGVDDLSRKMSKMNVNDKKESAKKSSESLSPLEQYKEDLRAMKRERERKQAISDSNDTANSDDTQGVASLPAMSSEARRKWLIVHGHTATTPIANSGASNSTPSLKNNTSSAHNLKSRTTSPTPTTGGQKTITKSGTTMAIKPTNNILESGRAKGEQSMATQTALAAQRKGELEKNLDLKRTELAEANRLVVDLKGKALKLRGITEKLAIQKEEAARLEEMTSKAVETVKREVAKIEEINLSVSELEAERNILEHRKQLLQEDQTRKHRNRVCKQIQFQKGHMTKRMLRASNTVIPPGRRDDGKREPILGYEKYHRASGEHILPEDVYDDGTEYELDYVCKDYFYYAYPDMIPNDHVMVKRSHYENLVENYPNLADTRGRAEATKAESFDSDTMTQLIADEARGKAVHDRDIEDENETFVKSVLKSDPEDDGEEDLSRSKETQSLLALVSPGHYEREFQAMREDIEVNGISSIASSEETSGKSKDSQEDASAPASGTADTTVPRSPKEAKTIDENNGDTKWQEAQASEVDQVIGQDDISDSNSLITVHSGDMSMFPSQESEELYVQYITLKTIALTDGKEQLDKDTPKYMIGNDPLTELELIETFEATYPDYALNDLQSLGNEDDLTEGFNIQPKALRRRKKKSQRKKGKDTQSAPKPGRFSKICAVLSPNKYSVKTSSSEDSNESANANRFAVLGQDENDGQDFQEAV